MAYISSFRFFKALRHVSNYMKIICYEDSLITNLLKLNGQPICIPYFTKHEVVQMDSENNENSKLIIKDGNNHPILEGHLVLNVLSIDSLVPTNNFHSKDMSRLLANS